MMMSGGGGGSGRGSVVSSKLYSLTLDTDEKQSSPKACSEHAMASISCSKPKRKTVYVALGVLLAFIVVITILATQLRLKGSDDCPPGANCDWKSVSSSEFLKDERCSDVCNSKSCLKAAMYSMKRIDPSQDPCQDFYKFACGAYTKATRSVDQKDSSMKELEKSFILDIKDVLDSIPSNGTGMKGSALRFAKTFYDNCMLLNTADSESRTTRFLEELFQANDKLPWPLVNKDPAGSSSKSLESSLAFLSSVSSNPLFQTDLVHKTRSKWLIELDVPEFRKLRPIYGKDAEVKKTEVYLQAMTYVLEIMGVDNETRVRTVQDISAFEKKVMEAESDIDMYPPTRIPVDYQYKCEELTARLRGLNWCSFVSRFLPLMGISPSVPALIHIKSLPYFQTLNKIIERTVSRDLINYVNVKFLLTHQQYLTQRFQYYHYQEDDVFPKMTIYRSAPSHWQKCVLLTTEKLWPNVYDHYVSVKFDERKRDKVEKMILEMNSTMVATIKAFPWMNKKTKIAFTEMFAKQNYSITLKTFLPAQGELDELFSMMSFEQRPLIEDALDLMKLKSKISFSSNINPILFSRSEPFFNDNFEEPSVGAHTDGIRFFRFPLLDFDRPKYLDYSTLGQLIMLSMTRVILQYMYIKNEVDLTGAVNDRAKCIGENFSHFVDRNASNTDEKEDLLNNLFHSITLQSTFQAYEKILKKEEEKGLPGLPLSNSQLFFIFYAQLFCESGTPSNLNSVKEEITPANIRINGAFSQSSSFGKAFRCLKGSPMNPRNKCCLITSKETDQDCV